jgi:hypothetical protein
MLFKMQQNNPIKVALFSKMSPNTMSGAPCGVGVIPTSQFQASVALLMIV